MEVEGSVPVMLPCKFGVHICGSEAIDEKEVYTASKKRHKGSGTTMVGTI